MIHITENAYWYTNIIIPLSLVKCNKDFGVFLQILHIQKIDETAISWYNSTCLKL